MNSAAVTLKVLFLRCTMVIVKQRQGSTGYHIALWHTTPRVKTYWCQLGIILTMCCAPDLLYNKCLALLHFLFVALSFHSLSTQHLSSVCDENKVVPSPRVFPRVSLCLSTITSWSFCFSSSLMPRLFTKEEVKQTNQYCDMESK